MILKNSSNSWSSLGGYKRMNLDGGGSTQMVSRPLGSNAVSCPTKPNTGLSGK
ncbi:phosphodiester glycosidase family protein [Paenibacillus larvae]|uniref:phosphodiester glycosidase family protein n=1 Tax=Paenibacillus larvae TaxID=1464 RepID=UPI00122E8F6B|nr:phosphodiester glycosidase family protein [Paenibacillus larvae]MCY9772209.1 phosphodiester glycosidase family protein [Paenibacillus larvae]